MNFDRGQSSIPIARIGAMARHVVAATEAPQDHSLLIPVNCPPYIAHQFAYSMNGTLMGDLLLANDNRVQFMSYFTSSRLPDTVTGIIAQAVKAY